MSKHTYADSTLKSWTKDELIHQIRILEHNVEVCWEYLENQAQLLGKSEPVVRCKDCEHWGTRKADGYGFCCVWGSSVKEDAFCSSGTKRRTRNE